LIVRPACQSSSKRPAANAGEEMALCEPMQVSRLDINNAPVIDHAVRNQAATHQVLQPIDAEWLDLVVVGPRARHPNVPNSLTT
jgi:hypothetical protein